MTKQPLALVKINIVHQVPKKEALSELDKLIDLLIEAIEKSGREVFMSGHAEDEKGDIIKKKCDHKWETKDKCIDDKGKEYAVWEECRDCGKIKPQ
jgi:hypothetical protein